MPNVLRPDRDSRENVVFFLQSVQEEALRQVLLEHLDGILAVGQLGFGKETQEHRDAFFAAIAELIKVLAGKKSEDTSSAD
jgi:hypothetical protein